MPTKMNGMLIFSAVLLTQIAVAVTSYKSVSNTSGPSFQVSNGTEEIDSNPVCILKTLEMVLVVSQLLSRQKNAQVSCPHPTSTGLQTPLKSIQYFSAQCASLQSGLSSHKR